MSSPRRDWLAVAGLKAVVSAAVLAAGFVAVSDDDFARVVIAQRFAQTPSLDPSGTSWLPMPFWIHGSAMLAFGRTLTVARLVAYALSVLSAPLVLFAATWLGLERRRAFGAAILAAILPHAVWLGVAPLPEGWAAALTVLALAALSATDSRRLIGALALLVATLSRYEAWPVAVVFSALSALDARHGRRWQLLSAAFIALTGPALWLIHGAWHHGDPLFFVQRVTAYREALGNHISLPGRLIATPRGLFAEPELALGCGLCVFWAWRRRLSLARYARPALGLAALLAFRIAGDLTGGAPTHHPERTLLSVWLVGAILIADVGVHWATELGTDPGARRRTAGLAALGIAVALVIRLTYPYDDFIVRAEERDIGERARSLVPKGQRLLIDTLDYGFFAVTAAFGRPEQAEPIDAHDPRQPQPADPFQSPQAFRRQIRERRADWLVIRKSHAPLAREAAQLEAENSEFALLRVSPASE